MNKYVTTITIIHEAESKQMANSDAGFMRGLIAERLAEAHVNGTIGPVRNVTEFSTREKMS